MLRNGVRLLVAEDNSANQEVAARLLQRLGYGAVEVVSDGQEALEALASADFDLVLMDCQMPRMDGYEATRCIRQTNSPVRNRAIPVVAMTAHAMAGDRAKCLAAGMNDYISKPVSGALLDQALGRWLATASAPGPPAETPRSPAPSQSTLPAFDREDLVERVMGNTELARRVVTVFLSSIPEQLAALAEAVDRFDAQSAGLAAHSIKGAAANAGALRLSETAQRAERLGKTGELAAVSGLLPELKARWEQFRVQAEDFRDHDPE